MNPVDYDVVVVGGGINGVGVAQAAAAAGYSVLVLEKSKLAAGTSQWSSKLIHGGLRYLESYQFAMVRESLRERHLLLKNAPELVHLRDFHIPVYHDTRRQPGLIRLGLSLYAVLGGLRSDARFTSLPAGRWESLDGLKTRGLKAVFRYRDGQTNDSALTRAVMQSAAKLGARLICPAQFQSARTHGAGVDVSWLEGASSRQCRARVLVNAAGPWVNHVAQQISPSPGRIDVELVQGAHLVVSGTVDKGIYYVESRRDGRAVFVMPWAGRTLVGTTETRFRGHPDQVAPLQSERSYLLSVLRYYFPQYADSRVESAMAGLRVLPTGPDHAFHRSRESILLADAKRPRVLSIYGGKLTTYRATAEKVLGRIKPSLPDRKPLAQTARLPLPPADQAPAAL